MMTREVVAPSCAIALKTVNPAMLRQPASATCRRAKPRGIRTLRCCSPAAANNTNAPRKQVATRMLNGGTSPSAILLAGQVTPQATLSATSMSRALASDSG